MSPQDIVISLVVCAFTLSALPMIFSAYAPPVKTSLIMSVGSVVLAATYVTLGLWLSVTVEICAAGLWGVLLVQGLRARRGEAVPV